MVNEPLTREEFREKYKDVSHEILERFRDMGPSGDPLGNWMEYVKSGPPVEQTVKLEDVMFIEYIHTEWHKWAEDYTELLSKNYELEKKIALMDVRMTHTGVN